MEIKHAEDILEKHKKILESLSLSENEYNFRLTKLSKSMRESIFQNALVVEYYSIAHEIKSAYWFKRLCKNTKMLEDSRSEPGVDIIYKHYQIECVCATKGNESSQRKFKEVTILIDNQRDYRPIRDFIIIRTLSVLYDKVKKYKCDLDKQVVKDDLPFVLFLSFGELCQYWIDNDDGEEALNFLIGTDDYSIEYNAKNTNDSVVFKRSYNPIVKKKNDSEIVKNFFGKKENDCVSGVIIAYSNIEECYTNKKIVMYCNPFALNPINQNDFPDIAIWCNDETKTQEYISRMNGVDIKHKEITIR